MGLTFLGQHPLQEQALVRPVLRFSCAISVSKKATFPFGWPDLCNTSHV